MRTFRLSPQAFRKVALIAVILVAVIIVTGAAVRLTGSGLGCPDWPDCSSGSLAPTAAASNAHGWIEFVNRVVTALLSVAIAVTVIGAFLRKPRRVDLLWLSVGLVVGLIAQIILGALVVEELLDPPFVMGHFLLSMVLLGDAIYLYYRSGVPDRELTRPTTPRSVVWMARLLVVVVCAVLVTGTIVTGAGPHSGDAGNGAPDHLRATRINVAIPTVARLHGSTVMVFLALVLLTLLLVVRAKASKRVLHHAEILLVVLVAQATIGYVQYFTNVPALLVGFHVAGAVLVFSATVAFGLSLYEPVKATAMSPTEPAAVPAVV
jgi:cytochrome c oxidase assembly protein subunit 15